MSLAVAAEHRPLPTAYAPRRAGAYVAGAAVLAAAFAAAALLNGYYTFVLAQIALLATVGAGLNLLIGLTGQISFGHAGFYALGAYSTALLTTRAGIGFWIAWPLGAVGAGLVGAALSVPALRVKGPYLAMITIAFGFVVEHGLVELRDLTGGQSGVLDIASPTLAGMALGQRGLTILAIVTAAASLAVYGLIAKSPWGLALRALRDAEPAAQAIGVDPVGPRTLAFAVSAALAAAAGGLFAPLAGFVTPSSFSLDQSILFVLMVVVGGAGSVAGPVIGALVVGILPEALSSLEAYRVLVFGALLLAVLWAAPRGLVGLVGPWFVRRRAAPGLPIAGDLADVLPRRARATLHALDLGMDFGGVSAADAVSFDAPAGQVTGLIGPNGAGKSTILNMLSGFYRPDRGSSRLGQTVLEPGRAFRVARAGVARTFQTSQLFGEMSVADNVAVALQRGRLFRRAADAQARALDLLAACGYRGDAAARASDLPHVDRRLIEIARALAADPDAILLDEPAAGLSAEEKRRLAGLLRAIAGAGVGVLLVEHDMGLVMGACDRIVALNAGRIIAEGEPAAIRQDAAVRAAYFGRPDAALPPAAAPATVGQGDDGLQVEGLSAGYGGAPILADVSLKVGRGETVAVLGANGAGKSTLMRALVGLHRPVAGRIAFEGADVAARGAEAMVRLGVVLVPEGRQVFPELSVRDNLRLGAFINASGSTARVEAMMERFPQLRARIDTRAGLLSGGEQQMLALARALMAEPKIMLLDEPSLGLAPMAVTGLFEALSRLGRDGATLVVVDQMTDLALALASHAYVLQDGSIVAEGDPATLRDNRILAQAYLGA